MSNTIGQNIIELTFDIEKFDAGQKHVAEGLMQIMNLNEKLGDLKVGTNGGYAELKSKNDELKKQLSELQNVNEKLAAVEQVKAQAQRASSEETKKNTDATKQAVSANKDLLEILAKNEIATKQLNQQRKELEAAYKAGTITLDQYVSRLAVVKEQLIQVGVTNQGVTTALKNIEKGAQAADGSLEQLRSQLNLALLAFDKMSAAEKEAASGTELLDKIKALTAEVSKQEQATGRFQRNVGNYAGSLAKPFESLIGLINQLKKGLAEGVGIGGATDAESLSRTEAAVANLEKGLEKASREGATATQQVKVLESAFISVTNVSQSFGNDQTLTSFVNKFKSEVGEAKDSVQDMKDEIKLQASDTQGIDNLVGSLNALAGVAQGAAGAYALFGDKEEDAAKITSKLLAIQGIANSVQQVGQELTRKGTIANQAYEFSQKQLSLTFDRSASAAVRFRAALISIGIGAFIVAVGLLVANWDKISKAISGVTKEQDALNEINNQATESFSKEATQIKLLVGEYQNSNTSLARKKEIHKQLNEEYPNYFKNTKTEVEFQNQIAGAADKATQALLIQAKVMAAQELLAKKFKDLLNKQMDPTKAISFWDKTKAGIQQYFGSFGGAGETLVQGAENGIKDAKQEYDDYEKFIQKFVTDSNAELAKLGGDPHGGKNKPGDKKKEVNDEVALLQYLHDKQIAFSNDVSKSLAERTAARNRAAELEIEIINGKTEFELKKENITANEIKLIHLKQADELIAIEQRKYLDLIKITQTYGQYVVDAEKEIADKMKREQEKAQQDQIEIRQSKHEEEMQVIQNNWNQYLVELDKKYAQDIGRAGLSEQQKKKITDDYNQKKLKAQTELQIALLQSDIDFTKETIELAEIRAKATNDAVALQRIQVEKEKLAALEIKLAQTVADFKVQQNKKDEDSDNKRTNNLKKTLQAIQGYAQQVSSIISGAIDAGVTRDKNRLQDLINKNNEYAAAEIERINNSTLSEQDKAAKLAQIQAEQAAKNKQYEQEQRQAEIRKARFDKAATIANIILSTALAVITALKEGDPLTKIPRSIYAGVTGAAQLAVAAATPIPTYAEGTDNHPGGPAIIGERKDRMPELVEEPGKAPYIVDKPTLFGNLKKGARVTPLTGDQLNESMYRSMLIGTAEKLALKEAREVDNREAWNIAKWQAEQFKEAMNKSDNKIVNHIRVAIDNGFYNYIQKEVFGK